MRGREFFSFAHCIERSNRTVIVKKSTRSPVTFQEFICKAKVPLTSVTLDKTRFVSGAQMVEWSTMDVSKIIVGFSEFVHFDFVKPVATTSLQYNATRN